MTADPEEDASAQNAAPLDDAEPPDLTSGTHLPNLRPSGRAAAPGWLPRQRVGVTPQMVGRYPDFDVVAQAPTWDPATRRAVLSRLDLHGPLRFFSPREEPTLRAFCDTVLAQDGEPRVPAVELVDAKLASGRLDGFQYAGMPDDRDTWRRVLRGLDEEAPQHRVGGFASCSEAVREAIVGRFAAGELRGGVWERLDVKLAWKVVMRHALSAFYSHPWAWNEIGFGGPAYPRGFLRMGRLGIREPYERRGATDADPARTTQPPASGGTGRP